MRSLSRLTTLALAGLGIATMISCESSPLPTESFDPGPDTPASPEKLVHLAVVECTASLAARSVACDPLDGVVLRSGVAHSGSSEKTPTDGSGAGLEMLADVIIGGQGTYVQLTSSNVDYDGATQAFAFDVTVQNLIPQPIGTTDGTTLDPNGIRVFFHDGPTVTSGAGTITVVGDGTATFTESNQPYFQYDTVLDQGELSAARRWQLTVPPIVATFTFLLYVSAAVEHPEGWVDLSMEDVRISEGGTETISAIPRTMVGNVDNSAEVTWASSDEDIATVDEDGVLTAVAPGFATLTASSGARSSTVEVGVCPDLAVGEVYKATGAAAATLCFGGAGTAMEFTYLPINLSASTDLPLTVTATGIQAVTGPPSPILSPGRAAFNRTDDIVAGDMSAYFALRMAERRAAEPLLRRHDSRIGPAGAGVLFSIVPGVPSVGDLWPLNVAQGCSGARDDRVGRVARISGTAIIVVDTLNPVGGFTTAQLDSIGAEVDSIAYPVVTQNFGAATDLDANGRIVLFITRAVNELSPPGSPAIHGYFASRDMFSRTSCERSNEGEILYLLAPDPTGTVNSNIRTVGVVRSNIVRTVGRELQSLVNAFRRIYIVGAPDFEEPWLDFALGGVAEELMFYRTSAGLEPGGNIEASTIVTGPNAGQRSAAYTSYMSLNFDRARSWLQRPDTTGAFRADQPVTQATQGATWMFLRYAADRQGGAQAAFWSSLVDSDLRGKSNLARAIDSDPDEWLRDFVVATYADDAVAGVAPEYTQPSWNFRSVYSVVGGFPLLTRPLTNGSPLTLTYRRGGGASFIRFGVPASSFADVTGLSGGGDPPGSYTLAVVRTK